MVFLYEKMAGEKSVEICDDSYHYLFRVRRHGVGDTITLANLEDHTLYTYEVTSVTKKSGFLSCVAKEKKDCVREELHIGWCIIDPRIVEKTLPMLNELGVKTLSFISCERSQANFKLSLEKLEKILLSSSQQCGRLDRMKLQVFKNLESFLEQNPSCIVVDFGGVSGQKLGDKGVYLVGCEGGFSLKEKGRLESFPKISFIGQEVLRSETAVVAIAAKHAL